MSSASGMTTPSRGPGPSSTLVSEDRRATRSRSTATLTRRRRPRGGAYAVLSLLMAGAAVALVAPAAAESAPAATSVVATVTNPTKVAAWDHTVVWSRYDPGTLRYSLVARVGADAQRTLPVPSRALPFDVDLGPDEDGHTTAVYSRCRRERAAPISDPTYLPLWEQQRGCRLYKLKIHGGREHRVRGERAAADDSDFLPSIWRSRIAYVHESAGSHVVAGNEGAETLRILTGARKQQAFRAGPRGIGHAGGDPLYPRGPGALDLDLRGTVISYRWGSYRPACTGSGTDERADPFVSELRIVSPGSATKAVASACGQANPALLVLAGQSAHGLSHLLTMPFGPTTASTLYSVRRARVSSTELSLGARFTVSAASTDDATYLSTYRTDVAGSTSEIIRVARCASGR